MDAGGEDNACLDYLETDGSSALSHDSSFLILRPANKSATIQLTAAAGHPKRSSINAINNVSSKRTSSSTSSSSFPVKDSHRRSAGGDTVAVITSSSLPSSTTRIVTSPIRRSQLRRQSSGTTAASTTAKYFDVDLQRCRNVLMMRGEGPLLDRGVAALGLCLGKGYCGQIISLDLHANKIGRAGIEGLVNGLVKGGAPKLEKLDLSRNELTGRSIRLLVEAIKKKGILLLLTHLDLKKNYIGDTGTS